MAAWFGLLVTALNLLPIGQLDGGHVSYAVFGERGHRWIGRLASGALLLLAIFSSFSWMLWWFVTRWVIGFEPSRRCAIKTQSSVACGWRSR